MARIKLPDGRTITVPDGLTEAEMETALRTHLRPSAPTASPPAREAPPPAPSADPNRSPRALPLPEVEWAPEVIPPEMRPDFFASRSRPEVKLGYAAAKRLVGRRR